MPKAQGIYRQEWRTCDRCGFLHPIFSLRRQLGLLLCSCHGCIDDLSINYRPKIISDVLSIPGEGQSEKPVLYQDPGENVVF